jgi:hypothetical protein
MMQRLKAGWRELRLGEPGRRFRHRHERRRRERHHGAARKWSVMAVGALILLAGIVLLPLPGPGLIVIAAGAVLVAGESRTAARALDQIELRARRLFRSTRLSGGSR